MNLQNKTIFAFTLAGIIALGALPIGTMSAFAQLGPQDDVNPPKFEEQDNSLVAFFEDLGIVFEPDGCLAEELFPTGIEFFFLEEFALSGPIYQADPEPRIENIGFDQDLFANIWEIHMPNIEDDFNTKLMRIQVTTCDFGGGQTSILDVTAEDQGSSALVILRDQVDDIPFLPGGTYFYEDYVIRPNPDFETITIAVPFETVLAQVVVDTISFDKKIVGGEFLPIDTTALLLAGVQTNASWIFPVVLLAAGIGLVFLRNRVSNNG